jgi:hypothetical protein
MLKMQFGTAALEGYKDGQARTLSFLADLVGMAYNAGLNDGSAAEQMSECLYMRSIDNGDALYSRE